MYNNTTNSCNYILKLVYKDVDKHYTEYLYFATLDDAKEYRKRCFEEFRESRFKNRDCVLGVVGTREEIDLMESHFTQA